MGGVSYGNMKKILKRWWKHAGTNESKRRESMRLDNLVSRVFSRPNEVGDQCQVPGKCPRSELTSPNFIYDLYESGKRQQRELNQQLNLHVTEVNLVLKRFDFSVRFFSPVSRGLSR